MLGALKPLRHDEDLEHWHLDDLEDAIVEDIDGIESFRQQSVGVDIGSSTSHIIFSELTLRRDMAQNKFVVAGRRLLHQSAILLTPYSSPTQIDAEKLRTFIGHCFESAGVTPADIDAGAVVITGEALKKENARPILEMFSQEVGKFICASAGPNHEALLAAHGSGAVALSRDEGSRVLLVDMGGGTTKLALIDDGVVKQTAAINIGARLIAFDEAGKLTRIEEVARLILGDAGNDLALGQTVSDETKQTLVDRMVDCLFEVIEAAPFADLTDELMITGAFTGYAGLEALDRIMFSGGVSEYVYGRDSNAYGDLGPMLGRAIRSRIDAYGRPELLAVSEAGIRATVIGAGEYTIQASGNTSHLANKELLPQYALQVVKPDPSDPEGLEAAVYAALQRYDLETYTNGLALALTTTQELTYPYLRKLAEGVAAVADKADEALEAMFIVIDKDVAKTMGGILKEELNFKLPIIAIDGIDVGDLDYIDIGRPMGTSEVLPVTVKSLIFPTKIKI